MDMQRLRKLNVMIFDARFDYEYTGGHIKGAINFDEGPDFLDTLINQENHKIFFSQKAIDYLMKIQT